MGYKIRINGEEVSKEEADRRHQAKKQTFLIPDDEWLEHPPQLITDDTFFLSEKGGEQFADNPALGDYYARELRARGGSPVGKKYMRSLARYPGDPEAWVSSRAEVKKICEQRGWNCDGQVKVKHSQDNVDPGKPAEIGDDIVTEAMMEKVLENPELGRTKKERAELWEETKDEVKPHWSE